MTRTDTARRLGCSAATVDRLSRTGRLDKVGGKVTAASIAAYVAGER